MDIEERIKALEDEFQMTKEELRQILLDIRIVLLEVQTPLPANLNRGRLPAQSDSESEVKPHGNQDQQEA